MVLTINGEELSYTLEHEKTVGDVLGAIESECNKSNRTITAVYVNGMGLDPQALDTLFTEPVDNAYSIDLVTVSGTEVRTYMQELMKGLSDCIGLFETIPVQMQTGNDVQALKILEQFSEKFTSLYRCLLLFDITGVPIDMIIEERSLQDYQKEITGLLQDITASIEENDVIQAGDLAEYELTPLAAALIDALSSFIV